ncbi:MAG: hypothetical protein V4501_02665 [Pseudomonadota bacterium]
MFGHYYLNNNFNSVLTDERRTLTFQERINRFRVRCLESKIKSRGYVNPDILTPAQVAQQNSRNDTFTTWELIYSKFRNQARASFLIPACAKFNSLTAVQTYVANNPTSRIAACLDIAKQICLLKTNSNHQITLLPQTLGYWNRNSGLRTIVNSVAEEFYRHFERQTATPVHHNRI